MVLTERFFATQHGAKAYEMIKGFYISPSYIHKLMHIGSTSILEAYHSSIYHKNLLDKDKDPQVKTFTLIDSKQLKKIMGPNVNSAVLFGSLRYNLGPDCKQLVMKKVAQFEINDIAKSRIHLLWARKKKKKTDLKKQAQRKAQEIGRQKQFQDSTKWRIQAKQKTADGCPIYVSAFDERTNIIKEAKGKMAAKKSLSADSNKKQ